MGGEGGGQDSEVSLHSAGWRIGRVPTERIAVAWLAYKPLKGHQKTSYALSHARAHATPCGEEVSEGSEQWPLDIGR